MWRAFICTVFRPLKQFLRCITARTCPHRHTEIKKIKYGEVLQFCCQNHRFHTVSKKIWSVSRLVLAILCLMCIAFVSAALKHSHRNSILLCSSVAKKVPKVQRNPFRQKDLYLGVGLSHSVADSLFKYSAAVSFATKHGRELTLDTGTPNTLQEIFDLRYLKKVDSRCWDKMTENSTEQMEEMFRNLSSVNVKLEGIFQSWKYWKDYEPESTVRKELRFRRSAVEHAKEVMRERVGRHFDSSKTFIGIHIVTKKFLKPTSSEFSSPRPSINGNGVVNGHGSLKQSVGGYSIALGRVNSRIEPSDMSTFPSLHYITQAMNHMRLTFGQVLFLVFCEDPEWCGRKMKFADAVILRNLPQSLQLVALALTRASILTTGSLGWWGAWLAQGYTVYPKDYPWDFLHGNKTNITAADYFLPSWVPL